MTLNNLRCEAYTLSKKVCKHNYKFIYGNKCLCSIHANMQLKKYIIILQKIWRGYKMRCYLNNIYYKLPYDLQYKIMEIIREEHRIFKWNKSVMKIYYINVNKIMIIDFNNYIIKEFLPRGRTNFTFKEYMEHYTKIYKLSIKFINEIENSIIKDLIYYSQKIKYILAPANSSLNFYNYIHDELYKSWYELSLTIDTFTATVKFLNFQLYI